MAHFVLRLVVSVALCSFSRASRHTCSNYQDAHGNYQTGLSCPVSGFPDLNYCCESSYLEYCCTETDWQDQNDLSHNIYLWVGVSTVIIIAIIVAVACRVTRTRRRAAVIVTSTRVAPPTSVVTVSTGNQATRVGPYQQFENPPSYTPN